MEAVDIAHMQCSRAWSLLRTLASQFSDDTCKFEGNGLALEVVYSAMDLIADEREQAGEAWRQG